MRSPPTFIAALALLVLCGHAFGDPAPEWDSTIKDPDSYLCTSYGPDTTGLPLVWAWDLTYLGYELNNNPYQQLRLFAVYEDTNAKWVGSSDSALKLEWWDGSAFVPLKQVDEWEAWAQDTKVAVEFRDKSPTPNEYLEPGNRFRFQATFTGELTSPDKHAIHITKLGLNAEDSEWVNNTPELGTWALLLLGIPVGAALRRRRQQRAG